MRAEVARCLVEFSRTEAGFEALFRFPEDLPVFAGHFPEGPLVPGVFLLEAIRLAAERVVGRRLRTLEVTEAKFSAPVLPGQEASVSGALASQGVNLRCQAKIRRGDGPVGKFSVLLSDRLHADDDAI